MPKFRVHISIDNSEGWKMGLLPYISPHLGLRRVLVIWGWVYIEAKLLRK